MAVSVAVKIMNSRRRKQCSGNIFLVTLVMEKKQDANNRQTDGEKEVGISRTPVPMHRWASSSVPPRFGQFSTGIQIGKNLNWVQSVPLPRSED